MKRFVVLVVVVALVIGLAAPAFAGGRHRHGHATANIALGLASFAVANQLFGGFGFDYPRYHVVRYHVVAPAPVVYYTQPAYIQQPVVYAAPPTPSVIHYPHGRYELRGYDWVWIPNPPAPPALTAACPLGTQPTGKYVNTTHGLLPECG